MLFDTLTGFKSIFFKFKLITLSACPCWFIKDDIVFRLLLNLLNTKYRKTLRDFLQQLSCHLFAWMLKRNKKKIIWTIIEKMSMISLYRVLVDVDDPLNLMKNLSTELSKRHWIPEKIKTLYALIRLFKQTSNHLTAVSRRWCFFLLPHTPHWFDAVNDFRVNDLISMPIDEWMCLKS